MIYIRRDRKDDDGTWIKPPSTWFIQSKAATKAAIADGPDHKIDESVYKNDVLRACLEELFYFKCAYCEKPLEEADWDVEHFRPKGAVAECGRHPAYYWLAYNIRNLYPSCKPCNQRRRDRPIWGDLREEPAAGKGTQFPLEVESSRVHKPYISGDQIARIRDREKTLLIDPCWDDPSHYLTFDLTGRPVAIDQNEYGKASISVFNLKRRRLNKKRKMKIKETIELLRLENDIEGTANKKKIRRLLNQTSLQDKHFSAAAQAVIADPVAFDV